MGYVSLVVGQAGTGKTTWLMERAKELAPSVLTSEQQSLLAITRMHGSRRRLEAKLRESCPSIPCSVATIDGFALSILNRWRTALGYSQPIRAVADDADFVQGLFGTDADFTRVLSAATDLLGSTTVRNVIGQSYPAVLVDEFQDCHGALLDFVSALSQCSSLLLAADDFQLLDTAIAGCPSVEWVETLQGNGAVDITRLMTCHRTSVQPILEAARCLRCNVRAQGSTIPVVCCPNHGPAAWKIVQALFLNNNRWRGSTALICPTHGDFLGDVLNSCDAQMANRGLTPIRWLREQSAKAEQMQIRSRLGLAENEDTSNALWSVPVGTLDPTVAHVINRSRTYSRLRGMAAIPQTVVARHVDAVVHERRAYSSYSQKRLVTTVHGAKNREFDNVFVLWPYSIPADTELQRRWLYNAITRSKSNCMLLVRGDENRARNDVVLSLLGPPEPAFRAKKKSVAKTAKRAKT